MSRGRYGEYGGQYISETLMNELLYLEEQYNHYINDQEFVDELNTLLKEYAGRPSLLYYAKRMFEVIYMFLSMDMDKISKVYDVQEQENGLELYPKKNVKGNTLEKIKLSFDSENSVVTEVDIIDKAGDNTIIKFNNSLTNIEIPSNLRDILNEK